IRRLIADAPLLAEIKSLGVPLTQLDDFDWGTTGLGGKGYSKNPEDGLTRSIPLMNKIRALRSMVAVMDRKCEAEFVVASWNRLFEKTHAGLFDVQIDSKKTEGYFVECEWRDRSRGDRYWGAPKGHDAAAHYLCTVEQGDLPFAWVVLFLHNESHAGRGDKDLAEKFYWLRKLCEEQCGAFEVHHSTKEVLPRLVSEAIGRLPASLVSVELLLAQCWVLAEAIQNDRVVRVVVASQFTQFNSFESHAQATPCWLLEKVTRMQLAASEAA
ncbi:MAG TPA: hypothetical protein VHO25_04575, partial [Polyangiaceae bacterium]|nr:hypothetical protein [Polyangiaceae bacterium]